MNKKFVSSKMFEEKFLKIVFSTGCGLFYCKKNKKINFYRLGLRSRVFKILENKIETFS